MIRFAYQLEQSYICLYLYIYTFYVYHIYTYILCLYMYHIYIYSIFSLQSMSIVSFGVVSQTEDVEACPQLEELDRYGQHLFLGLSCSGEKHTFARQIGRKSVTVCKVEHQVSSSSWIFFNLMFRDFNFNHF